MAIIDPDGLFNGERLKRCSIMARLYWPYFWLASNGFGRLEISYHRIVGRAFSTFEPPPSEGSVMSYLKEYADAHLLFIYECDGQLWGQWDAKENTLNKYKTASDRRSPAPPQKDWDEWVALYRSENKPSAITRAVFFKLSGELPETISELSGNISEKFPQNSPLGVGVGVGVGVGKELSSNNGTRTTEPDESEIVKTQVWPYYLSTFGRSEKSYSWTDLRRLKGVSRYRECRQKTRGDPGRAVELMKLAIDRMAESDFHTGRSAKSNGKKYIDWELHLFKSREQMERWWNSET